MRNEDYCSYAEHAVVLEKDGKYQEAALYWQLAWGKAKKEINKNWSLARSQFCNRMSIKPFEGN
ncbi:hypothetical protein QV08_11595 [Gallibacterium salpingitidis]|uniref:ANR family transcriptional regulator n=1 Tax=Gallibacterium salpingitidis TaxID=505341 RepID=A0AB36E1W8_9PAST|nr:ANR family transcriptional regulator [Gallibacterium salpingitidis]OBX05804.1 hypothetical protein QV08_11595 [Gallibacterium salpingitidis]OBX09738.1 hypothetical protein QV09_07565 [Gallibacterium salpingitidis]